MSVLHKDANVEAGQVSEVDLLVLGAGAGGMTAALTASILGLNVCLVEKTAFVGGTTARSAGSIWVPNTQHCPPDEDSPEKALTYLRNAVGNHLNIERAKAFLKAAPEMVELLEANSSVKLRAYPYHPDYLSDLDGATLNGRTLEPHPFDGKALGKHFADVRSPLPEFMLFGGMMVNREDIGHLRQAHSSAASFLYSARMVSRYALDRVRYGRGARLVMGNALVGRLYHSLLERGVPVHLSTEVTGLIKEKRSIVGAELAQPPGRLQIRARAGVILATGGLSNHPDLRARFFPSSLDPASPVVAGATGDGAELAKRAGGGLSEEHESNSFWAPVSSRVRADGSTAIFPHFVLDRGKPGMLAIDPEGRRFVNEATTYHLFGEALLAIAEGSPGGSCFLICDDLAMEKYGLGMVRPRRMGLRAAVRDGYVTQAESIAALAAQISVAETTLAATVQRHNGFAETGTDVDFAKGETAYQRNLGDAANQPNPCIGKCTRGPFYALEIRAGDIGASAGLVCDPFARVLDKNRQPIEGLYACGNDMESIMAGRYPGPGITIGPAMAFGFVAAKHAAERLKSSARTTGANS